MLEIPPSRSVFVEFGGEGRAPARPQTRGSASLPESFELTGWTLTFPAGWGAPEKVALERPVWWTDIPGFTREAKAFSGTVTYETAFECSDEAAPIELDHLGRVESIADVYVNGLRVRTLWCEPYRCRMDGFVRKGRNRLRIEVTNTWRNRVILRPWAAGEGAQDVDALRSALQPESKGPVCAVRHPRAGLFETYSTMMRMSAFWTPKAGFSSRRRDRRKLQVR